MVTLFLLSSIFGATTGHAQYQPPSQDQYQPPTQAQYQPATAPQVQRGLVVAVFDIQDSSKRFTAAILEDLTEYLSAKSTEIAGYNVVPRDQIKERLKQEVKKSYKTCFDQSCQIELGKELAAQKSLSTRIMKIGSKCSITATLYDLMRSASEKSATANVACTEDGMMTGITEIVQKLDGSYRVPVPSGGGITTVPASSQTTTDPLTAKLEAMKLKENEKQRYIEKLEANWIQVKAFANNNKKDKTERLEILDLFLRTNNRTDVQNPHRDEALMLVERINKGLKYVEKDSYGIEWAPIPTGSFMMGCSPGDEDCAKDEKPRHSVNVNAFLIMSHETTQSQYRSVIGNNPSNFKKCGDDCPVENVSWHEAKAFCQKIGGRLPTEAEWEYATRAGTGTKNYCGDNCLDRVAWYTENSGRITHPVKKMQPNAWGLYDTLGNVWEWVEDCYSQGYDEKPGCWVHVLRGGSFDYYARSIRVSYRLRGDPDLHDSNSGFRCARDEK
jgi:formylglycine-generating enzyme required for sulfatase activity